MQHDAAFCRLRPTPPASVANNTREDGRDFLEEAARVGVRTRVETFAFERAPDALIALKRDGIRGAAVILAPDQQGR